MEKGARIQQHAGHAPKKCSIRGKRIEYKVEDSDICGVWEI